MAQGYKGFAQIGRQANANIRRMKAEIEAREKGIDLQEPQVEEKEFSLSGGVFFKENPDKLLAEPYEGSSRFGTVTKYRPKKGLLSPADALKEIETPLFIAQGITDKSAGQSVILTPEVLVSIQDDSLTETALAESEKDIIKTQRSAKRKITELDEPSAKPTIPFEDILRTYNKDLSDDEIKAFLWYMHHEGNTYKGKWLNILNPTLISSEQESAYINSWVKSGILFYYKGDLLPAFIYLSENLYDRNMQFEKDKSDIINIYGQAACDAHELKLKEAFNEIYQKRLKLDDPDLEKRLHLKPYGDFTNSIQIRNWNLKNDTGEPDEFSVVISGSEKTAGQINWKSTKTSTGWRDPKRETLSINDAFRYYLKYDPNRPSLPHNFQWEDIFRYYLDKGKAPADMDATVVARNRALTKEVGDKLFSEFLANIIIENDRVMIETVWNEKFNSSLPLNTKKIPIGFEAALYYPENQSLIIEPEKREAVAFASVRGSSLNAYQVGVGKTWAAIFTIAQFLESRQCSRPCLVVPNQVYKQFYSELHGILPHIKINDLFNLSKDYYEKLLDENGNIQMVEEGSVSIFTYEGFLRIGFKEETESYLLDQLDEALVQIQSMAAFSDSKSAEKDAVRKAEKLKTMLGKALQRTTTNIEDLGLDFICFDEAHTLKNIFSSVKAKDKGEGEGDKAGKKMYDITGSASTKGIKAYCLCSYLQLKNNGRNVLLLTATPFSNSPLEIFSMLSLVAYRELKQMGLSNINDFFDNYCQMSYELIINSKLQPIRKQIFKAFDNLQSLRKLIYKFMLHKEAGVVDSSGNIISLIRPNKYVLPYLKGHFDSKNNLVPAKEEELVDTVLPLSPEQKGMMDEIIAYVEGTISYKQLESKGFTALLPDDDDMEEGEKKEKEEVIVLDESYMDDKEKAGVKTLRGVNFARSLALSPYLYEFSGLGKPDYKKYIEGSPKLTYIIECIRSVKKWHEEHNEAMSGQVIYMDRGKQYFNLIKDYLVNELGFKSHEIGIIRSGKEGSPEHKDAVKNGFNGLLFNEKTKLFDNITDSDRIKVIIGTSSIREGLNLNRYSTCLYNACIDWRPTDEIQLEGRIWRQGNTFENIRIIIPMMSDSMDIFMLQKLEEKTQLINSIWNWNDKSNVFKIEELDPKEQKLELITNPKVIAQLMLDDSIIEADEKISEINNNIQTAENIIGLFDKRAEFEKELMNILTVLEPDKTYSNIEAMARDFERLYTEQEGDKDFELHIQGLMRRSSAGNNRFKFLDYSYSLYKPWTYGNMKGAVVMLKKAQRTFFEKYQIADEKEAVKVFIEDQARERERKEEEKKNISSDAHIEELIEEIEQKRKEKKIRIKSVTEQVESFKKLNYLLGLKSNVSHSEDFRQVAIEGCPPITSDGKPDITIEGIKKLESCLEKIPQTKELNTNETGEYTEARLKLHKIIKGKLRAGMACVVANEKPIAILMGGVPGSSKTTFLKKYAPNLLKEKIFKIDADEIRSMLPEYKGWNSKVTHKETQDIYHGLLDDISEGKPCRFDILWDGTMNRADNYLPLIGSLKHLGYEIFMIYMKVPWEVSRKRTLERYVKGSVDGNFGRYVPVDVVDAANQRGTKAFDEIRHKADGYMMVDGITHEIIERGGVDLLSGRGYFDHEPTAKEGTVKVAKAKAMSMKQRIRILNLKEE